MSCESRCEDRTKVITVGFRVIAAKFENFGDESLSWPALQLDEDVQGIGDVAFDRAIRQFDPALKNAACKPRKGLGCRACVNG